MPDSVSANLIPHRLQVAELLELLERLGELGATRGLLIAVRLSYLALWLDALRLTGTGEIVPPLEGSAAAAATGSIVAAGVEAAMGEESGAAE